MGKNKQLDRKEVLRLLENYPDEPLPKENIEKLSKYVKDDEEARIITLLSICSVATKKELARDER